MKLDESNYLEHYGILRKSGRYPWGSGKTPDERNRKFLHVIRELKGKGMSEADIAKGFDMTTTQLRALRTIALNQQKQEKMNQAQRLRDKGYSHDAIAKRMGLAGESSVRALLAPGEKDKVDVLQATARMLREEVDKKTYLDIGGGVEHNVGVTRTKLDTAIAMLEEEGYKRHYVKVPQVGVPGNFTTQKVLTKKGVPYSEVYRNRAEIKAPGAFTDDGGRTYFGILPPMSISSKRIAVNYAENGGEKADGVMYVRPGVKDLEMGGSHYAQVRIAVDGSHYLKGMAIYKEGLPKGKDIVFNTNKSNTGHLHDALKPLKQDPDNPFGAQIKRQIIVKDEHGKDKLTSAMNIVNEQGDWGNWSRSLSAQVLSKQDPKLARQQLAMTHEQRVNELDTIKKLTNPAIKRKLLESYAESTDAAAVGLKAAALPRQASHVLMPVAEMKPTEIYAPNYRNGEHVVLVRYPHGGKFEIPLLAVNNRQPDAKRLLGPQPEDAVGIHPKVAEHLSGADFDGDTVLVIPNDHGLVKVSPALEGLKDFNPKRSFPAYDGMKTIDGGTYHAATDTVDYGKNKDGSEKKPNGSRKQQEMGNVTNLIADMTIRGANNEELARAVRHSMVVIDSEKHVLDFKGSAAANGIAQLKAKYQGIPTGSKNPSRAGASTLITRANSEIRVAKRKPRPASEGGPIDRATGEKKYKYTGETYVNRAGKTVPATFESKKLAEVSDAHKLSSGTRIEAIYADHANKLKALANEARKTALAIQTIPYSPSAKTTYADQVRSLDRKLAIAERNRPKERQAQVLANAIVSQKRQDNPTMDPDTLKKIRGQALIAARIRTGADKELIDITPEEWNAIQAGAISHNKLTKIINNTDLEKLKELAMPAIQKVMTSTKKSRATQMLADGYTQAEVADLLGVSVTTLRNALKDTTL